MATTTDPVAAAITALANYLTTQIRAQPGYASSPAVVDQWPEPTTVMKLGPASIAVFITHQAPGETTRMGGPITDRATLGVAPAGLVFVDYDELEVPITLGMYAVSKAMRDDADYMLQNILNQPRAATITPLVNTTLPAIVKLGVQTVIPTSIANIWPGVQLLVDVGANLEIVEVIEVYTDRFTANFTKLHAAATAAVETMGLALPVGAVGLFLRCPLHFNTQARFDFDNPRTPDSDGGAQSQEWRSITNGMLRVTYFQQAAGVLRQRTFLNGVSAGAPTVIKQVP